VAEQVDRLSALAIAQVDDETCVGIAPSS